MQECKSKKEVLNLLLEEQLVMPLTYFEECRKYQGVEYKCGCGRTHPFLVDNYGHEMGSYNLEVLAEFEFSFLVIKCPEWMQINLDVQDDETLKIREPKKVVTMVMLKGIFNLEMVSIWYAKESIFNSAWEEWRKIMQNPDLDKEVESKDELKKIEEPEDEPDDYEEPEDEELEDEELEEVALLLLTSGEAQTAELESMTKADIKIWADAFEFNVPSSLSKAEMIERFIEETEVYVESSEGSDEDEDEDDESEIPDREELESMTKAEIKEWADAFEFNVPLSLSKAEMIERFIEEVDENVESEYEFPTSMTEMILWLVGACLFGAFVLAPLLDYLLY